MTPDTRESWKIAISIWTQTAAHYLRYLDMTNGEAETYRAAYKVGDIRTWANERITKAIETANATLAEHNTDEPIIARNVAQCSVERLRELGLSGAVQSRVADTTKIDELPAQVPNDVIEAAREFVEAERAWWDSLSSRKTLDAAHWHSSDAKSAAWAKYTGLLREHGMEPADRRGYAKTLIIRADAGGHDEQSTNLSS